MIISAAVVAAIAVVIIVVTPTAALILLSWPHPIVTRILLIMMVHMASGLMAPAIVVNTFSRSAQHEGNPNEEARRDPAA
jgi:pilus assembly protein TadC